MIDNKEYLSSFTGTREEAWRRYLETGGLPVVARMQTRDEQIDYLHNLCDVPNETGYTAEIRIVTAGSRKAPGRYRIIVPRPYLFWKIPITFHSLCVQTFSVKQELFHTHHYIAFFVTSWLHASLHNNNLLK